MAAARMVLLATTVVLFAAAWSGDRPRARSDLVAIRPTQPVSQIAPARRATARRELPVTSIVSAPVADWLVSWSSVLPADVAIGDYLLVEASGQSQRIALTPELLQSLGHDPDVSPQPFYILKRGHHTAYLIRIVPAADAARIAADPQTVR